MIACHRETLDAMMAAGLTQADLLQYLGTRTLSASWTTIAPIIELAREQYPDADLKIDDAPLVSPADCGTWVSAWVWVGWGVT